MENSYPDLVLMVDPPTWYKWKLDKRWATHMTVEWYEKLKGWTQSEDFEQKAKFHGLTPENRKHLKMRFNKIILRIMAKSINVPTTPNYRKIRVIRYVQADRTRSWDLRRNRKILSLDRRYNRERK